MQRHPHPGHAPTTARPAGATTSAEVASTRASSGAEPIQRPPIRHAPLPEVEDERVDQASGRARRRARSPRRDRADARRGATRPDPGARGDGRVEGAVEVEPGRQAAGRLRRRHGASASVVAPPPEARRAARRAARPATGTECRIERGMAGRDRRARRPPAAPARCRDAGRGPGRGGLEGVRRDGSGGIGPWHWTADDRTDVRFRGRAAILAPARGDVAQLGEHRVRIAGVRGSSPLISTRPLFSRSMDPRCH